MKVEREAKAAIGLAVILGLLLALVWYVALPAVLPAQLTPAGLSSSLSSEEVVQAFRNEGLEVGETQPVDEDADWQESMVPKTYKEGTRFVIPSLA